MVTFIQNCTHLFLNNFKAELGLMQAHNVTVANIAKVFLQNILNLTNFAKKQKLLQK